MPSSCQRFQRLDVRPHPFEQLLVSGDRPLGDRIG